MAAGDPTSEMTLEYTQAWARATVSAVFILISIVVERSLHVLGHYLHRSTRKSLELTLQKLKDELMLMGFISLTITIITNPLSKICVKSATYSKWTAGDIKHRPKYNATYTSSEVDGGRRRLLATAVATSSCEDGKEPFVSTNILYQLHILIFVLACVYVYTSRKWEKEAVVQHDVTEFTNSVRFSRQSTFVRYH